MKNNLQRRTDEDLPLAPENEFASIVTTSLSSKPGGGRRLSGAIIVGIPIALVLVTFLFWYQTWFGRRLSGPELSGYLQDTSVPHKTQHALTQVAAEILHHDPTVERVYPQVIALGGNKEAGLRSMAAWVMGQDNKSSEFHQALSKLIADPEPVVRWNAALALARFGDDAGQTQLRMMLRPYDLRAAQAGAVTFDLKESDPVRPGSVVARIKGSSSDAFEIRSPMAGVITRRVVNDGVTTATGDVIAVISPDEQQIWEALQALYLVGKPDALEEVDRFARPSRSSSQRVREQAGLTAEAIRKRAEGSEEQLRAVRRKLNVEDTKPH